MHPTIFKSSNSQIIKFVYLLNFPQHDERCNILRIHSYFSTKIIVINNSKLFIMKMRPHYALMAIGGLVLITLVAWAGAPRQIAPAPQLLQDTVPGKKKNGTADADKKALEKELKALEKAKAELEKTKEIDFEKMQREIEASLKSIDFDKIQQDVQNAMKSIDMVKMEKEITESLSKIDFDKMQKEIEESLKDADIKGELEQARQEIMKAKLEVEQQLKNKEWKKEMEKEMKKVDMKQVEKELLKAKAELQKVKAEMQLEKINFSKELEKARTEIDKAEKEMKGYQEMLESMKEEGLVNSREDYTIEFNKGDLFIDGKKQSDAVSDKYKKYFKKDKTTIKYKNGDFNIDVD